MTTGEIVINKPGWEGTILNHLIVIKAKQPESGYLYDVITQCGVAETERRSCRCSYVTPHEVITSCRLPDKWCFAFISHCFMSDCKVSTFFHFISVWDDPFPAPTFYQHAVMSHYYTVAQTIKCAATMDGGRGRDGKGEIAEKGQWLCS